MAGRLSTADLVEPFEDGLSARALLSSIRRHLALVVTFALLFCIAGALLGLGQPSWFQAEGVVVIHARPQRMAELQELPDPSPDPFVIQSEVDVLQSRSVIEPVVRALKLWEAPEFQETKYPWGWNWQTVQMRLGEIWRDIWGNETGAEDRPTEQPVSSTPQNDTTQPTQAEIDGIVEAYRGFLSVQNDGRSMTIRVSYRALTRERAADVVNAHIDSYRKVEVKAKVAAAERTNSALRTQVTDLRQKLQVAEAAVTRYREEHHLTGAAKDSAGVSQQLAALNTQLITTRAELAESEARAARIGAGAAAESLPEVVASGTVAGLRGQEAQLTAREADLSRYHGDEYPELQRVRASLKNLRDQISRQIGRDRAAALQMVDRSRTRERSLQQSITELTKQLNSADAGLQQLQGNAESIRSLLVNFEKRMAETAANPAFITPNSTIASSANPSAAWTSPKTKTLALAGGFVGFTLGSLLSLLLEFRDRGFRTSAQVQQHLGSLTVSGTPRLVGRRLKPPADIILTDNRSALAEAFRVSWANIQFALAGPNSLPYGGRPQGTALGISSAASGEGKSTHALGLARTAARAGESVVLVDADLRRSGLSRSIDQPFYFTLEDFLEGRCAASDVIAIEERSGVHFVPSVPANISWTTRDLQRFSTLVHHLKGRFSVVIIDLPPILGLAETIRLAMVADAIALVIRWGRTERQFVQFALDALRGANISPIAVILNDIDLKTQRRRGDVDGAVVYSHKGLYRAASRYREPAKPSSLPIAAAKPDTDSDTDIPEPQPGRKLRDRPLTAQSDIERLYNQYYE